MRSLPTWRNPKPKRPDLATLVAATRHQSDRAGHDLGETAISNAGGSGLVRRIASSKACRDQGFWQALFSAVGKARKVIVRGANVSEPEGVAAPVMRGTSSLAVNCRLWPLRRTVPSRKSVASSV